MRKATNRKEKPAIYDEAGMDKMKKRFVTTYNEYLKARDAFDKARDNRDNTEREAVSYAIQFAYGGQLSREEILFIRFELCGDMLAPKIIYSVPKIRQRIGAFVAFTSKAYSEQLKGKQDLHAE